VEFVIRSSSKGQFCFSLLTADGQLLATSEFFAARHSATQAIVSIREEAHQARCPDSTALGRTPQVH
jgi:uncharacterized protein YegP (UPF0339 family)